MSRGFWGYLANPDNKRTLKAIFVIVLVIVFGADFLVHRHHAVFIWDEIPGWSAVYGFVSCVIIIFAYLVLGHGVLMKKENYYD